MNYSLTITYAPADERGRQPVACVHGGGRVETRLHGPDSTQGRVRGSPKRSRSPLPVASGSRLWMSTYERAVGGYRQRRAASSRWEFAQLAGQLAGR